ncbi:uncharacterized protein SCHCODRAFT_02603769 [Schizophyllum commune H4-8]|uniref:Uncharacterized protein n=1 Tax=Schizophyllum commune (strain H4-8 / FGSC 9210) TaxID=578458 RepID=D8QLG7_SCHCM|nr:uncharacterized protein SCHCODRAFT_02603769 [Schizophyllum commune H4-8]KAI5884902.1 hypothetical protein SCHCODRAFT_02603769 [Schizophyllum commune H4-8]
MASKLPPPRIPKLEDEHLKLEQARLIAFTYLGNPTNYESSTYAFWIQFWRIMSFYTDVPCLPSAQHAVFGLKAHEVDNITQQLSFGIPGMVQQHTTRQADTKNAPKASEPAGGDAPVPDGDTPAPDAAEPREDTSECDADPFEGQASPSAEEDGDLESEPEAIAPEDIDASEPEGDGMDELQAVEASWTEHAGAWKANSKSEGEAPERPRSSASENRSAPSNDSPSAVSSSSTAQHTEPGSYTTQRIPDTCLLIPYTPNLTRKAARQLMKARTKPRPKGSTADQLRKQFCRNPMPIVRIQGLHKGITLFIPVLAEHKGGPGRTEGDEEYDKLIDGIEEEAQLGAADQGRVFLHNREYFGYQDEVLLIATVNDWYSHTTMRRVEEDGMFKVQMEPWSRRVLVGSDPSKKREAAIIAWINEKFGPDRLAEMAMLQKTDHEEHIPPTVSDDEPEPDHGKDADYLPTVNIRGRFFRPRKDTTAENRVTRKVAPETEDAESAASRKRKRMDAKNEEESTTVAKKVTTSPPSGRVEATTKKTSEDGTKRGVRFADGEPLAPVTDEVDLDEAPAKAAAAAVTVEYLASRPNDSWTDIKKMPIPPEAEPHLDPTYTRDRKGRLVAHYPVYFALVFSFEVESLYRHLKRCRQKYRDLDMGVALHVLIQEVYAALRIDFGAGITHSPLNGKLVYTFIMSLSDRPETLPYPAARICRFQEIVGYKKPPTILAFRPKAHRVRK